MTTPLSLDEFGRLLARPKAITGPGVAMLTYSTPISSLGNSPQRRMREAYRLSLDNPWVRTAEQTVTRRVSGLPWHLEDASDEEIADTTGGPVGVVQALFEKPQAAIPELGYRMTWRDLIYRTSWRMGACGVGYWFLDQMDMAYKFPLGVLFIEPWRLWPSVSDGGNLVGWVLDPKDETGRGGVPLEPTEVLPFYLVPPDDNFAAQGLVETAGLKAQITTLADKHAAYTLATGGRLAGVVAPKAGVLSEDQFAKLVREFRNVAEQPDAAKRLTIVEGPVDFTRTAGTPGELELINLSTMNRDDILAIWGVPPALAGVPQSSGGLNSGETRKYDEAVLMQGAVHDRVTAIRQVIQYNLLDRLGQGIEFEFEEPEFDDHGPAYDLAGKARELPLTNSERRELIGLDPFGIPEIDNSVWLPVGLTEAYPGGAAGPEGAPEPVVPPALAPFTGQPPEPPTMPPDEMPAKASPLAALRARLDRANIPAMERAVAAVLADQRREIAAWIEAHADHVLAKPGDTTWWNARKWDDRMRSALAPFYVRTGQTVHSGVASYLGPKAKADPVADAIVDRILRLAGVRITGINATTRDAVLAVIRDAIAAGFSEGEAPAALAARVAASTAFDEYRAERIARTESMFAYNASALESYREFDVQMVEPIDGDDDEECAARLARGAVSIDEAMADEDHPNGSLDWVPVL